MVDNTVFQHVVYKIQEFSRESVFVGEDQQETIIRVTRTESNITTVWSLDKFEERLTAMRQIYNV